MPNKHRRHFTQKESEYIRRNAGKVPACVMAEFLNRKAPAIYTHASRYGISLAVPRKIMNKHWREYVTGSKRAEAKNLQAL